MAPNVVPQQYTSPSLLALPEFILFKVILSSYLSIKELSALDRAISKDDMRQAFHSSLINNNYTFEMTENQCKKGIGTNFMNFIFRRNICVPKAFITKVDSTLMKCNKSYKCIVDVGLSVSLSDEEICRFFSCCGGAIKSIHMTMMASASCDSIKAIAKYCSSLQLLDIRGCCQVKDNGILALASSCSTLTHLNVSSCGLLRQDSGKNIASNLSSLTFLDVQFNSRVDDEFLQLLGQRCRKIKVLNICNTKRTTDFEVTDTGIMALAGLDDLVSVDMRKLRWVTSAALSQITPHWPRLLRLSLAEMPLVDDSVLKAVADHLCSLQSLDISWCRRCTDAGVAVVINALSGTLENINLSGVDYCGADTFEAIAKCPNLLSLCLHLNINITTPMVKRIVNHKGRGTIRKIRALVLWQCYALDDNAIMAIIDSCPELQLLDIGGLRSTLTLAAITHIAASACALGGRLKYLGLVDTGLRKSMEPVADLIGRGVRIDVEHPGRDVVATAILAGLVNASADHYKGNNVMSRDVSPRHIATTGE